MNKKKAIRIMTNAASTYHENLENQNILFLYAIPKEVEKEITNGNLPQLKSYEVIFRKNNFLHLTGVRVNKKTILSATQFYDKCRKNRLTENDFEFSKDGTSIQKLEILEMMMNIKINAVMIGDFIGNGPKLYSDKMAGGVFGGVGFVREDRSGFNVPNTLLKKDIRDVIGSPKAKIYAVLSKRFSDKEYQCICKMDRRLSSQKVREMAAKAGCNS